MTYSPDLERIAAEHNRSPLDVLELFLERASIREFCGGLPRAIAEFAAVHDCEVYFGTSRPVTASLAHATSAQEGAPLSGGTQGAKCSQIANGELVEPASPDWCCSSGCRACPWGAR